MKQNVSEDKLIVKDTGNFFIKTRRISMFKFSITYKFVNVLFVSLLLFSYGCGQAALTHKLNTLNNKFEKRLTMKDISMPSLKIGQQYTFQLEAANGIPPYNLKIIQGELPTGLTFEESTGKITGTPQDKGSDYPIVVLLTDSSNNSNNYILQSFYLNFK